MSKSPREIYDSLDYPTVVVVGGGFAGLQLTHRLDHLPFKVLLVDKNNFHTFQPLLYQVATGSLTPDSIAYPFRRSVAPMDNVAFRMAEVTKVIPEQNIIETNHGQIEYDYLVLANGSKTNFYGNQAIANLSMRLKSISQALDIRSEFLQEFETATYLLNDVERSRQVLNFVVVGGGPTGVEMSGALAEIKNHVLRREYKEVNADLMQIWTIDAGPQLLNSFSDKSSKAAKDYLENMGVNVRLNSMVKAYDGKTVELSDGTTIETNTVIWSAGVMGSVIEGFSDDKIEKGSRYKVDRFNRVEGYDNIFALGDVASMKTELYPKGHPMVAQVALQQANMLAKNLRRIADKSELKPFEYKDKGSMATIGRRRAVVDIGKFHTHGAIAWYIWMLVHIWSLIGFRNRMAVLYNWFWKYLSWRNTIRLIVRPYQRPNQVA